MNYGEAKARARKFVNNRKDIDFDDVQPLLVDDLNTGLDIQENEGIGSLVPVLSSFAGISSAPLPSDFGRIKQVKAQKRNLEPTDIQSLLDGADMFSNQYAISGMSVWVQSAASLTMIYAKRVPLLSADGDTNVILDRFPNLYVYGLAKHANSMVQDFDAAAQYESQYVAAIELANANNVMAIFSAGVSPISPYAS